MGNFYFDIETTGLDSKTAKIITIQFQELNRGTGEAIGELTILKEWESSEREILTEFIRKSGIEEDYPFTFIPTGYNLNFEHNFLKERTALHSLNPVDILNKPFIDLRAFGIIMNKGEFKGSGLDKISGKKTNGKDVPIWYQRKEYGKIIDYIKDETKSFIHLNAWLYKTMPEFLERYKKENKI
ncbi:MAG: ribonuclease H-like domain-containing protein [Candidatus Diapherotrites archaeon]|nr:ribonuclease H-like domain-containing protein [Candidatus Diapherotrites archaeon]